MAIQKNPFLKYVIKDNKEDFFHSSAYGKAQSGANMGAASTESYQVRVNIDRNRQNVKGYKDSELMTDIKDNTPKAKTYNPSEDITARGAGNAGVGSGASSNAGAGVGSNAGSGGTGMATRRAMMSARTPMTTKTPSIPMRKMI